MKYDLIIVGGGAAGFFTAINVAIQRPKLRIAILERSAEVLSKVKISGGGRCNVTHAEFIPDALCANYPRGKKELKGPFHTFMTGDTMEWFEQRGVALKIEEDGRIFPASDTSASIINCFLAEAKQLGIEVLTRHSVKKFEKEDSVWKVMTSKGDFTTSKVMIATGSNTKIWQVLQQMGHTLIDAVPSLFTFNIKHSKITELSGLATGAQVRVLDTKLQSEGPLLITHWGMSGPAVLKLSAWGALQLNALQYRFTIAVNWVSDYDKTEVNEVLKNLKTQHAKQQITTYAQFELPKRLWQYLVTSSGISPTTRWAELNKKQLATLAETLTATIFEVDGKSTFKEEFVTAGGIDLKEVNFKTYESKVCPSLYFAGEVLNIDAITGGFNFQNAWTGGFIAAKAIASEYV